MTFDQMQDSICSFLQTEQDSRLKAVAGSGINIAIDEMNVRVWNFMLTTSGFPFQAGITDYTFTSGVRAPRNFGFTNSDGVQQGRLLYFDPKSFDQQFPDRSATGIPSAYTVIDNYPNPTVVLNCTPSVDWVAQHPSGLFRYNARIPNLTSSGQSLDGVPPEAVDAIMWNARTITALSYDQHEKVDFAGRKYVAAFRSLRSQETETQLRDFRV